MTIKKILSSIFRAFYFNKIPQSAVSKDALFVHIPKAAGSSISLELYNFQIGHRKAKDYLMWSPFKFSKIKKFAIVRDPVDRFVSAYNYLQNGGMDENDMKLKEKYLKDNQDINEYIGVLTKDFVHSGKIQHFLPQKEYLYLKDTCIVDFVYKLESLDVMKVNQDLKLNLEFKNYNQTKNSSKTILTDESINRLKSIYRDDMYLFGYNI